MFLGFDTHSAEAVLAVLAVLHVTGAQAVSLAAAWQTPAGAAEHVSHTPLHAELQHTPSTQLLLAHSEPPPHV